MSDAEQVNFGHEVVSREEKTERVGQVFHKVAGRYDIMNDLMSFGAHRLFKRMVIETSGVREGHHVLDLAGGTGDMSALFAEKAGASGRVVLADPNVTACWIAAAPKSSTARLLAKRCRSLMILLIAPVSVSGCATLPIKTKHCVSCCAY